MDLYIPVPWLEQSTLRAISSRAAKLLILLCARGPTGSTHANTIDEMVYFSKMSNATVRRALNDLCDLQLIKRRRTKYGLNVTVLRHPKQFIRIPKEAIPTLQHAASENCLLFLALARLQHGQYRCAQISQCRLAKHLRLSVRTIQINLKRLYGLRLVRWHWFRGHRFYLIMNGRNEFRPRRFRDRSMSADLERAVVALLSKEESSIKKALGSAFDQLEEVLELRRSLLEARNYLFPAQHCVVEWLCSHHVSLIDAYCAVLSRPPEASRKVLDLIDQTGVRYNALGLLEAMWVRLGFPKMSHLNCKPNYC